MALGFPLAGLALDPPHSGSQQCASCHIAHNAPGGTLTTVAGNANLCISCHSPGGRASGFPFASSDQALPAPGLPPGVAASGTSHRWDSGPAGHAVFLGGATTPSTGTVEPHGAFTGHYAKTYTITIATAGNVGTATFDWTATSPSGGTGSNLLTGASVPLDEGVSVAFVDGTNLSFQVNDAWHLHVRTDLQLTTNATLLAQMTNGQMTCSTCHEPHSQAKTPFDPTAPGYPGPELGYGRHFQRLDNDTDQMCLECHAPRNVASALAGSHPVGLLVPTNAHFKRPVSLPLDKTEDKMRCSTCHRVHFSPADDGTLLRMTNQVALCSDCHTLADTTTPALHFSRTIGVLWPGGQYGSTFPAITNTARRGACGNCHQAHGWPDAASPTNDFPTLLVNREENLCYTCHDGSPATFDLKTNFTKTYRHPVELTGRHVAGEAGDPFSYGATNRHAECSDCHNVHALGADGSVPVAPLASARLKGVNRVSVTNLGAGNNLSFTFRPASDPTPVKEHELCFLCHSSWTTQPAGQSDLAAKFNTLNTSFHPVEAAGKNTNINPNAFVNGWSATNTMYCTDCHGSDDPTIRGPHGSQFPALLKKSYPTNLVSRPMSSSELCFDCHRYDTYANNAADPVVKAYSRFGGSDGHGFHVGSRRYPCYTCHDSHGAPSQTHNIVTGRTPGIVFWTEFPTSGNCSTSTTGCHENGAFQSYLISYPR
ncbi:MAG: hypothetical protein HZA90_18410 [Verrucomicrobia bacterium]|nr:hypothetical protein [Verrucomicrobiota bacterium]